MFHFTILLFVNIGIRLRYFVSIVLFVICVYLRLYDMKTLLNMFWLLVSPNVLNSALKVGKER